jgi:hypothetical protein
MSCVLCLYMCAYKAYFYVAERSRVKLPTCRHFSQLSCSTRTGTLLPCFKWKTILEAKTGAMRNDLIHYKILSLSLWSNKWVSTAVASQLIGITIGDRPSWQLQRMSIGCTLKHVTATSFSKVHTIHNLLLYLSSWYSVVMKLPYNFTH